MANLLSIDPSDCTRCGACASACPMGLLRVGARGPRTIPGAEQRCILCGHCITTCPAKKLQHANLPAEQCLPLDPTWRSTPQAVQQLIKGRRSIRCYQDRPVEKTVLAEVLDTSRYAPTAVNCQSVKWLVVYQREAVRQLSSAVIEWMRSMMAANSPVAGRYNAAILVGAWDAGHDPILRNSPHVLVAYGPEDPLAQGSCTIALTTTELAAASFGLSTCWAGFLHVGARSSSQVADALGLPAGNVMHGGLMIGYPAEQHYRIPPRKGLEVTWR